MILTVNTLPGVASPLWMSCELYQKAKAKAPYEVTNIIAAAADSI